MPQTIKLGTRFALPEPSEAALERVEQYLRAAGYEAAPTGAGRVSGHRGRGALTPFSFSPRAWGAEVDVELKRREGRAEVASLFTVTVEGQVPTSWENDFWREEVLGLERAVLQGDVSASRNRQLARRAIVRNVLVVPVLLTTAFAPIGVVVHLLEGSGSGWFIPALVGTGLAAGLSTLAVARALGLFAPTDGLPLVKEPGP